MKSTAFLEQVAHNRKAAIYAAEHDGNMRNFAYHEGLGECRETFSRLLRAVQKGEVGVVMTSDAACLSIETSPGWMESFIQAVKQHEVLISDHVHDLVYDLCDEEDEAQFRGLYSQGEYGRARSAPRPLLDAIAQSPFVAASIEREENWFLVTRIEGRNPDAPIYSLSSGAKGKGVDMFGVGRWKEILDALAPLWDYPGAGLAPCPPRTKRLALPYAATRGRVGRANNCRDETALGFSAQRRAAVEGDPAWKREGAGQEKAETRRKVRMREPLYSPDEEHHLARVALACQDVPAAAFTLLSVWIEGERVLVDDRGAWEGSTFPVWIQGSCRRSFTSPLHFSPAAPGGMASICSCTGMWGRLEAGADTKGLSHHAFGARYDRHRRWHDPGSAKRAGLEVSRSTCSSRALDPAAAFLWSDDAPAKSRV